MFRKALGSPGHLMKVREEAKAAPRLRKVMLAMGIPGRQAVLKVEARAKHRVIKALRAMVHPGQPQAEAKVRLWNPKVQSKASQARAGGPPRPRQVKVKGSLLETSPGGARPPA